MNIAWAMIPAAMSKFICTLLKGLILNALKDHVSEENHCNNNEFFFGEETLPKAEPYSYQLKDPVQYASFA